MGIADLFPAMADDFCEYIGLVETWPSSDTAEDEFAHEGHLDWARSYFEAAESLHFEKDNRRRSKFFAGPLMQITGLATELTLKCLMRGSGATNSELKKVGHCTYAAYLTAREAIDEVRFIEAVMANSAHLPVPCEIADRMKDSGEDPNIKWRVYFDHLRILDTVYDRPYRNRYMTPGEVILPEPEIILVGTKLLIAAMEQRLDRVEKV